VTRSKQSPFVNHIGITIEERRAGFSRLTLAVGEQHINSVGVVHGGVSFALMDTAMGAALVEALKPGEKCATLDVHISYLRPVTKGVMSCTAQLIHHGNSIAHLESSVHVDGALVARATGNFAIIKPKAAAT
jgi:acyl-CoA thioesterase